MSHAAIAAVLALDDVSAGERLAAFSLASFADRSGRSCPGTPAAATRAGVARSAYLQTALGDSTRRPAEHEDGADREPDDRPGRPHRPLAVDLDGTLLVASPAEKRGWVADRFRS